MDLVVFVSYPVEASVTAVARGLEVLDGIDRVVLVSTQEWSDYVEKIKRCFEGLVDVDTFTGFRDPLVDPRGYSFESSMNYLRSVVGEDSCVAVSSGSRLEISSMLLLARPRCAMYVAFGWGPWRGAFYPYTPRPLEVVYTYGDCSTRTRVDEKLVDELGSRLGELLHGVAGGLPELRRRVLETQLEINKLLTDPLVVKRGAGEHGFRCPSLSVSMGCRSVSLGTYVSNYCDPHEMVSKIGNLAREALRRIDEALLAPNPGDDLSLLSTILRLSGLATLALGNKLFVDALKDLRRAVAIDTNVVYGGLHTQLYDSPETAKQLVYPICVDLELYTRIAQARDLRAVEAELALWAAEEIKNVVKAIDYSATYTPCEVSLYLSKHSVATSDRRAFERLLSKRGSDAYLLHHAPLDSVEMKPSYALRRASYAYYAVAQLVAIARSIKNRIRGRIRIEIKLGNTPLT